MTDPIQRATLRDMRYYVRDRKPFVNTNHTCYAQFTEHGDYVVYSYGTHWPLFVYRNGVWYENEDKYGVTTSRHHSACHPLCETVGIPCKLAIELAKGSPISDDDILRVSAHETLNAVFGHYFEGGSTHD